MNNFKLWVRDRSLGIAFVALFLAAWVGQAFAQAAEWLDMERDHGSEELSVHVWDAFKDADFWEEFWSATLENWQSEFLQLATFTIFAAYLVYKGSAESRDGEDRIEAKLDALLGEERVKEIEANLPWRAQKTNTIE